MASENESHISYTGEDHRMKPFTYDYYENILRSIDHNYKKYFLRHDVDFSLEKAEEFARKENKMGYQSHYFVLVNGDYYNPFSGENIKHMQNIVDLGHQIQIHIDLSILPVDPFRQAFIVGQSADILENITHQEVNWVTFHKPVTGRRPNYDMMKTLAASNLNDPNMNKDYHYISDSGMEWRENPFEVMKFYDNVHVNTHPVWYDEKPGNMEDRLCGLRLDKHYDEKIYKEIDHIREYLVSRKHQNT